MPSYAYVQYILPFKPPFAIVDQLYGNPAELIDELGQKVIDYIINNVQAEITSLPRPSTLETRSISRTILFALELSLPQREVKQILDEIDDLSFYPSKTKRLKYLKTELFNSIVGVYPQIKLDKIFQAKSSSPSPISLYDSKYSSAVVTLMDDTSSMLFWNKKDDPIGKSVAPKKYDIPKDLLSEASLKSLDLSFKLWFQKWSGRLQKGTSRIDHDPKEPHVEIEGNSAGEVSPSTPRITIDQTIFK